MELVSVEWSHRWEEEFAAQSLHVVVLTVGIERELPTRVPVEARERVR
jgi:hypothetical protein